ncbi:hypothetical protein RNZ50_21100 [Paracoccaceae bacterium Fryx2]|nr:hypothetical protein [Paracoccaceae bacterium Fryx2]
MSSFDLAAFLPCQPAVAASSGRRGFAGRRADPDAIARHPGAPAQDALRGLPDPAGRTRTRAAAAPGTAVTGEGRMQHPSTRGRKAPDRMLDEPATGRFRRGRIVSLADICPVPQAGNARHRRVDVASFSRIPAILDTLHFNPAFAAAAPDSHKPEVSK